MEKNGNSTRASDSMGVCEKLFSAITVNPAFRTIRRITHFPQDSASPSPAVGDRPSPLPGKLPQPKSAQEVIRIPITCQKKGLPAAATPNVPVEKITEVTKVGQGSTKPKVEPADHPAHVFVQKSKEHLPEKKVISIEQIHGQEAKAPYSKPAEAPKSPQVKNEGKKLGGADVNDIFSDFIHRAKNKFKSTPSNVGVGKNSSFKRD